MSQSLEKLKRLWTHTLHPQRQLSVQHQRQLPGLEEAEALPWESRTIKTLFPVHVFPVCSFQLGGTQWGGGGRTLFVLKFITLMKLRE